MLNRVMLIGNLGKDPDIRSTNTGKKVANISVATTSTYNGKKETEWHKVVMWNKTAEIAEKYLKKGSQVYIEGKLVTRSWDDQNGQKKYTTEIIANHMSMIGKKNDDDFSIEKADSSELPF